MKNLIILILAVFLIGNVEAQIVFNNCPDLTIEQGLNVTVQGGIVLKSNGNIINNGILQVEGNIENNNKDDGFSGSGEVVLNGSNQNISGNEALKFYDLTLEGTGTKTISCSSIGSEAVVIGNELNLNDGKLDLNSRTLVIESNSNNSISYSQGGMVSESIDGSPNSNKSIVKWNIGNSTGNYELPFITTDNIQIPLQINITKAGSITGSLISSTYPTTWNNQPYASNPEIKNIKIDRFTDMEEDAVNRYWRIDFSSYSKQPEFDITFSYNDSKDLCKNNSCSKKIDESNLAATRWDIMDSSWHNPYFNGSVDISKNTFKIKSVKKSNTWWALTQNKTYPYPFEEICMVTVDSNTNSNFIIWDRTRGVHTAYYNIYKESTTSASYNKIGQVSFDSISVFVDSNSSPAIKADRYKIASVDSFGQESVLSGHHKTIHLTANSGTSGENNLSWSHYEGFNFNSYKIYRKTVGHPFVLLNTIQNNLNSFTDANPPSGKVYYLVLVEKSDSCMPNIFRGANNEGPFSQSFSNIKDYGQSGGYYMNITPTVQTISKNGGSTAIFNVFTNLDDWNISNSSSWLNVTKNTSAKLITATATENTNASSRKDSIVISNPEINDITIYVIQEGSGGKHYLIVSPTSINIEGNIGSSGEFSVNTDLDVWDASSDKTWLVVSENINDGKITVTSIESNTDQSPRSAIVTVTGDGVNDQTVVVIQNNISSIEENAILGFNVFPNPFDQSFKIEYSLTKQANNSIRLLDVLGNIITQKEFTNQLPGDYSIDFNLSDFNLDKGIYFIQIINENNYVKVSSMVKL